MRQMFLFIIFVTFGCSENSNTAEQNKSTVDKTNIRPAARYNFKAFPVDSEKASIYLDSTLLNYMDSVKLNSTADYIINFYTTSNAMVRPRIDHLISVTFNLSDSIFNATSLTSRLYLQDTVSFYYKSYVSTFFSCSYNPTDSILKDIKSCNFFKQPSTIEVIGADGFSTLIEIKTKEKYNYIIRWTPNIDASEKESPKRKEILKFCGDLVKYSNKLFSDSYSWCK
jgi:hypothetical protein